MIKYIVHTMVQHNVYAEYVEWLQSEHVAEVLACPGFVSAEVCLRKGGALEASSREIKVIYTLKDEDHLKSYLSDSAMKLREKAIEKFPGQFSSQREVWLETITFMSK